MKNSGIVVCTSRRPWWHLILAAAFFSIALYTIYFFVTGFEAGMDNKALRIHLKKLTPITLLIVFGIRFSMNRIVHLDSNLNRYKIAYELAFLKIGRWKKVSQFEYVSVFNQPLADGEKAIDINVWYDNNRRIKIYRPNTKKTAMDTAKEIARKMHIDLLDATEPQNQRWVSPD